VDDGSTDNTANIVKKYAELNGVQLLCQLQKGPSAARNTGIRACKGQYIAFLDADDYWSASKIEKQVDVLQDRPDIDVVYCLFHSVHDGKLLSTVWHPLKYGDTLYEELLYQNVIAGSNSAVLLRTDSLKETGLFDEDLYMGEDQDLWRRLAYRHNFFCIQEYLTFIRVHPQSAQADSHRVEMGTITYLNKLKVNLPPEYQFHLKRIFFYAYKDMFVLFHWNQKKALKYYCKSASLGLEYFIKINQTLLKLFPSIVGTIIYRIETKVSNNLPECMRKKRKP